MNGDEYDQHTLYEILKGVIKMSKYSDNILYKNKNHSDTFPKIYPQDNFKYYQVHY